MSRPKFRPRHVQDLGPLGLPSRSAWRAADFDESGSLEESQLRRSWVWWKKRGHQLGKARSLALLDPEGFVREVIPRRQTLDVVLHDWAAGCLLAWCGFSGDAPWTLSFKNCRRVEWLMPVEGRRAASRPGQLRPASMKEVIESRWRTARSWADFEPSTGLHLRRGWVQSLKQPLVWIGEFQGPRDVFLLVECERAVVIDDREEAMRCFGGEDMADLWRRFLGDATVHGLLRPDPWLQRQGIRPAEPERWGILEP
ncbi:MAG: hypothetical protein MH204_04935 [Fimbriimonadaceae bacterium]|nr:hypothetical protein [Fimbriimonadaceae bacterium]